MITKDELVKLVKIINKVRYLPIWVMEDVFNAIVAGEIKLPKDKNVHIDFNEIDTKIH